MKFRPAAQVMALAIATLALAAASAASGGIKDPKKGVPADHAIYVVAVNINTADADESASAWRRLSIVSTGEKPQVYSTDEALGERNGTVVYTGYAPAGKYRVHQLYTWSGNYSRWAPLGEGLGTFELVPGRVNVIGLVMIQPLGRRFYMTRQPLPQGVIDYVRAVYPTQLQGFKPEEPVIAADWPSNAAGLGSLAQRNAPFARSITIASDGTVLAPAKLGQVQRLEADERWVPRPTGAQLDLISLAEARSGGFVVGGEFGAVLRAKALHSAWTDLQLPAGAGAVHAVAEAANGDLYAVAYHGLRPEPYTWSDFWNEGAALKQADIPLATAIRVWKRAPGDSAWSIAREIAIEKDHPPLVFGDGRAFYLSAQPFMIERFDVDKASWEQLAVPVDSFTLMPDGMLTGVTRKKGPIPQVSRDGGRTWTPVPVRNEELRTQLKPAAPLVLVGPDTWVARGKLTKKGKTIKAPLFLSSDGGKSWDEMPNAAGACGFVADLIANGERLWVLCASEQVFGWDPQSQEFKPQREFATP